MSTTYYPRLHGVPIKAAAKTTGVTIVCLFVSVAAAALLPSETVVFDTRPFSPAMYVALLFVALIPGGWVSAAGGFANVAASLIWQQGVPNYIAVGHYVFNVADITIVAGTVLLAVRVAENVRK